MSALLVQTTKGIEAALKTARDADAFDPLMPQISWDFDGRQSETQIVQSLQLLLRVIVPRNFEQWQQQTRGDMSRVAAFDIDVRKKLHRQDRTQEGEISRDELEELIDLVEKVHEWCADTLSERRVEISCRGQNYAAEWIPRRDDVAAQSGVLVSYSPEFLREHGQFFGVCREVFEITEMD